jgi:hypothetical protein
VVVVVSLASLTSLLSFHMPLTAEGEVSVLGGVGTVEDTVSSAGTETGIKVLAAATEGSTGRLNRGDDRGLL